MADILDHHRIYPRHGAQCSCLDKYSRELWIQITGVLGSPYPYDSLLKAKASRSVVHVLRMVTDPL